MKDALDKALAVHGFRIHAARTGSPDWTRWFIQSSEDPPLQVGRVSVNSNGEFSVKDYQDGWDGVPEYPDDMMMPLVKRVLAEGSALDKEELLQLLQQAVTMRDDDLKQRQSLRDALPSKKRKKLKGKNVRRLFLGLLMEGKPF
jgi:hypothetical protein